MPHLSPGAKFPSILFSNPLGQSGPLQAQIQAVTIELMERTRQCGVWMVGLLIPAIPLCAQTPVERGKYLVEHVAHCGDCHTPTTPQGNRDMTKTLKGVSSRISTPDITASGALWTDWKEEGFLSFLEIGQAPSGQPARHPMPPFKLRPDDAGAIVQYLKTLK